MKMSQKSFNRLKKDIHNILEKHKNTFDLKLFMVEIANNPKIKDPYVASRWYVYNAVIQQSEFDYVNQFYRVENLNDSHIDTALRKIFKNLY